MPTQLGMARAVIAIEADVLFEKEAERSLALPIPMGRTEHRAKDARQSAILIASDARRPCPKVNLSRLLKINESGVDQFAVSIRRVKTHQPAHELVMVHPFTWRSDAGPWRQVVSVALAPPKLGELLVIRMQGASNFKILAELDGEIIICFRNAHDLVAVEFVPCQPTDFIDYIFEGKAVATVQTI